LTQRERAVENLEKKLEQAETVRADEDKRKTQDFESQIRALKSELGGKDRKMQDLESSLSKIDKDAESKLATANAELLTTKKLMRELQGQNAELRSQITSMTMKTSKHEEALRHKEDEVSGLVADVQRLEIDNSSLRKEIDGFAGQHNSMQEKHEVLQGDLNSMRAQRAKMEREAAEVRKALERVVPFFSQNFA
jgi:myosin protein heavy chain